MPTCGTSEEDSIYRDSREYFNSSMKIRTDWRRLSVTPNDFFC